MEGVIKVRCWKNARMATGLLSAARTAGGATAEQGVLMCMAGITSVC